MAVTLISPTGIPVKLDELMSYNPETGELTWLPAPREAFRLKRFWKGWNTSRVGKPAMAVQDHSGYLRGAVFGKSYSAHRVAWALAHGEWPADQIDHISGERAANRLSNLRAVANAENQRNTEMRADNSSGVVGVSWHKQRNKWHAQIGSVHLGYFAKFDEAIAVRKAAEREYGYHENHGRHPDLGHASANALCFARQSA